MYREESDSLLFEAVTTLPDEVYCDNWIAQNGLDMLKKFSKEQPWHLVVNFAGPHDPYDVTESMRERWKDVGFPPPIDNDQDDPELISLRQQNYAAMIENIDNQIGRYLDLLKDRGELENTVIIFSSDHGEMLGDHNRWQKSIWYRGSVDIPLIMKGPNVGQQESEALLSFHDIGATILDLAGAEPLEGADAISFRPVLEGASRQHRWVLKSALSDWKLVSDGKFKLVLREGNETLLFDLREDPDETTNLAKSFPCKVEQLQLL